MGKPLLFVKAGIKKGATRAPFLLTKISYCFISLIVLLKAPCFTCNR